MTTPQLTVICYHYIKREAGPFVRIWGHDWDLFKRHIDFFSQHYSFISLQDLDRAWRGERVLPARSILLTFDDGLREHGEMIGPYLANRRIPALFNVCSDVVLDQEPTISQVFHFGAALMGVRSFATLVGEYLDISQRQAYHRYLKEIDGLPLLDFNVAVKKFFTRGDHYALSLKSLRHIWHAELASVVPDIFQQVFMGVEDLKQLIKDGHEIGLHTASHRRIATPLTSETFEVEIVQAQKRLEGALGGEIISFTYPFGGARDVIVEDQELSWFNRQHLKFIFTTSAGAGRRFNPQAIGRYLTQSQDEVSLLKHKLWFYEFGHHQQ